MNLLLEFHQSSRVITADDGGDKLQEFLQRELMKLDSDIKLVIDIKSQYEKKTKSEKPVFLQRFSSEWKQFVDVIDVIEIESGDRLKAVPFKWPDHPTSDIVSC